MTSIRAGLVGSTYDQVVDAMNGMIAGGLAFANGEDIDLMRRAEVYALVLKVVPPDILTDAALRLVASEQFFPSAATWLKACDGPIAERQRMQQRVAGMIQEKRASDAPFVREEPHQRLAGMIATFRRYGARYEGRIAAHQKSLWELALRTRESCRKGGHSIPAWSTGEVPIAVKLHDGTHNVTVEPPPASAPPPEKLPFGIAEPAAAVDTAEAYVRDVAAKTGLRVDEESISQAHAYADEPVGDDLGEMP